jgi:hypothetical protein
MHCLRFLSSLILISLVGNVSASSEVRGKIHHYRSPNGVQERCVAIAHIPGGVYSTSDNKLERQYCAIDFYNKDTGLCPKTHSTSPGAMVYDLKGSPYAGYQTRFEKEICARGFHAEIKVAGEPLAYKVTMNAKGTSGTFSTASLLYYHFSRYLDAAIHVPVSVYREMDRKAHRQRVTRRGLALSAHSKAKKMIHAAWTIVDRAETRPSSYKPTDELFTVDRKAIYGILIHPKGTRYSPEINGTRKSGWGVGQSKDFQQTPPFLALRSAKPLAAAIDDGLAQGRRHHAKGSHADPRQMAFWMQELTEITLLDYIFSQQDRIDNIDYRHYWYWLDQGRLQHRLAHGPRPPKDIAAHHPIRLKRTWLNDNDAGGRRAYANFTKKTWMLEKIRHYNPRTWKRLMAMERDFAKHGKLYQYVRDSFGLSAAQLKLIVDNTHNAAAILKKSCRAGHLRFDLDPEAFFLHGSTKPAKLNCAG